MNLYETKNKVIILNNKQLNKISFLLNLFQNILLVNIHKNDNIHLKSSLSFSLRETINFNEEINTSDGALKLVDREFLISRLTQLRIAMDKQRFKIPNSAANVLKNDIYQDIRILISELRLHSK
jgi:hypothetical protein